MNWKNWFRPAPPKHIRKNFRPSFESLEVRETPSTTLIHTYSNGYLTIRENGTSAAGQTVQLIATASNSVDVKVGAGAGTDVGTFKNVSSISVILNNGAGDTVKVLNTAAATTFTPNITITEGSGAADVVNFDASAGVLTLTGRVGVTQSVGAGDTVGFDQTGANALTLTNAVNVSGGAGVGTTVTVGTAAGVVSINGNYTGSNNSFSLAAGSKALGNITLSDSSIGGAATVTIAGTVGGNVNFIGGSGTNTLTVSGIIGGSLYVSGGSNANSLTLTGTVGKNLTYSGAGADTFVLTAGIVGGNATLNFGNAANVYTLSGAYVIDGNFYVTAGNSSAGNSLVTTSGTVNGNMVVNFGNSNAANVFTISSGTTINGSLVSYTGGTGGDTVTVSKSSNGFALNIFLNGSVVSAGTDTVNLSAVTALASLLIIEGAGATTAWTPPVGGITWPTTLINWP